MATMNPRNAARKKAPRAKLAPTFTASERKALEPLIIRAALAAMKQSKAEARFEKASASHATGEQRDRAMRLGGIADDAQRETCAAGAALAKAIKAARRGAK